MAWISNSNHDFLWVVTTHPRSNFNGGLVEIIAWVIKSSRYVKIKLLLRAIISITLTS